MAYAIGLSVHWLVNPPLEWQYTAVGRHKGQHRSMLESALNAYDAIRAMERQRYSDGENARGGHRNCTCFIRVFQCNNFMNAVCHSLSYVLMFDFIKGCMI